MKNILRYTLAICTAGLLPVACTSNFDEYNTNQNQMEMGDVHPLNLLEHILFTGADGMVYRTWLLNNELIQYTVQMYTENVHRYMIRDSYNSGTWNHLARWAANSDHMIEQAVKNGDANSEAIALTMRALFVSNWTDIYGDIPFSEAFQGRNNVLKPKFDTQKEVYTQLFADLERANSLYDPSRALRYPNKDLMYKGDIAKWRKFTNSLHMRLLMRLQNRDEEMGVSEKLREIVSNPSRYPVMASNADNAALFYTNVDPFIGHFGTTTLQSFTSNSHRMAEHLVNLMNNTNDPRLGIYAVQQNNEWTGLVSGYPTTETNATNCAYLNKDVLGDSFQFVKENTMCTLVSYKGNVFSVEAPNFMELEVTATEPGVRGDTATNVTKPATLETGAIIKVPLFINEGEKIQVDTRTGEYLGRVKE